METILGIGSFLALTSMFYFTIRGILWQIKRNSLKAKKLELYKACVS